MAKVLPGAQRPVLGAGPQVAIDVTNLPELLYRAADRVPGGIALVDGSTTFTYAELRAETNRVANYLVQAGCTPGARVASMVPRNFRAIVLQCAVMAAGAVYVPLDSADPRALLAELLDSAAVDFAVGDTAGLSGLEPASGRTLRRMLTDDAATNSAIAAASPERPAARPAESDAAYIMHTSGTTGRPKGVLVSHGAASNAVAAWRHHYPEHPISGFLMVSPLTFDGSIAGIWWTFADAGTLVLAPTDTAELVTAVRETVQTRRHEVSHTFITPTLYRHALRGIGSADTALRQVVVGGEECPESLVAAHHQLMPDVGLINIYGPTETTVWCTTAKLIPDQPVVVGKPLMNMEILLVDPETGAPTVAGVGGEVCIAGAQLAQGYVGEPKLTAEKFVPHPYRNDARMYRSGDFGRWRSDGTLELDGRIDSQVQIRGQRVELSGISAQLGVCPGVDDVVVAIRDVPGGRGQKAGGVLTAYVVPASDTASVDSALRDTWEQIYDDLAEGSSKDPAFDTTGWNSSYTGAELSADDMTEWVDTTANLMLEEAPSSVLDLGCGTGMPLFRVAPHCHRYVGLDPSAGTISNLAAATLRAGLGQADVQVGVATDAEKFAGQDFDLVVCNSVTQYFPGVDYQARVLHAALDAVRDGGRVIFGDVRDLSLETEFHSAVVRAQSRDDIPSHALAARVRRRMASETEFVIDPRWFARALADRTDVVVEVRPRCGRRHNEMTAFRFDAVIHRGASVEPVAIDRWYSWTADRVDHARLRDLLAGRPDNIGLRAVPNARTRDAVLAASGFFPDYSESYHRGLADAEPMHAVEPDDFLAIADEFGYHCHLSRIAAHPGGAFDVALLRKDAPDSSRRRVPIFNDGARTDAPGVLATEPRRHQILTTARASLIPSLRRHAISHLPARERPDAYVVVLALPVTDNGKLDFAALPAPGSARPEDLPNPYLPPRSLSERVIAQVWADILGLDRVGVSDHFTELGGDSLQAARAAILLSEELGLVVSAGAIMETGTIRGLAETLGRAGVVAVADAQPTTFAGPRSRLPLTEAQTLFWFLDHYGRAGASRDPRFTISAHYRISGEVDTAALGEAVDRLVERHEALRVRLLLDAADGTQEVVQAEGGLMGRHLVTAPEGLDGLLELGRLDTTLLDPPAGKVFSADLFIGSPVDHLLVLQVHHMVSDGWSLGIIEDELSALYAAAAANQEPLLASAPSYSEAVMQNYDAALRLRRRDESAFQRAVEYWERSAKGARPFRLAASHSQSEPRSTELCSAVIVGNDLEPLLATARAQRGTVFTTVLTGLGHLLARDNGDSEVSFLSINAARDKLGSDRLVGFVVNPFLVRFDTTAASTFGQAVGDISQTARSSLVHSDIPMLAVCEEIPELIDTLVDSQLVVVESVPDVRGLSLTGCRVNRIDFLQPEFSGLRCQLPSELALVTRHEGNQLRLSALYDPGALDRNYVQSVLTRLERLLVRGGADPGVRLDDLVSDLSHGTAHGR